jgi:hypothetical protein
MTDQKTVTKPSIEPTRAVMPERARVRMEEGTDGGALILFHGFTVVPGLPADAMPYLDETAGVMPIASDDAVAEMDRFADMVENVEAGAAAGEAVSTIASGTIGAAHCFRPLLEYGNGNRRVTSGGHTVIDVRRDGKTVGIILRPQVLTHEPVMHDGRKLGTVAHTPDLDIHGHTWGTGADPMGLRITTPYDDIEGSQGYREVL